MGTLLSSQFFCQPKTILKYLFKKKKEATSGTETQMGFPEQKHCVHVARGFLFFWAVPWSTRDPSSPTRDGTRAPCRGSSES